MIQQIYDLLKQKYSKYKVYMCKFLNYNCVRLEDKERYYEFYIFDNNYLGYTQLTFHYATFDEYQGGASGVEYKCPQQAIELLEGMGVYGNREQQLNIFDFL